MRGLTNTLVQAAKAKIGRPRGWGPGNPRTHYRTVLWTLCRLPNLVGGEGTSRLSSFPSSIIGGRRGAGKERWAAEEGGVLPLFETGDACRLGASLPCKVHVIRDT